VIEVGDLRVERGGRVVVRVDGLTVDREVLAVMGPNGAGKTTLLEALDDRHDVNGRVSAPATWHVGADPPQPAKVDPAELVAAHGVGEPRAWLARVGYQGPASLARGSQGERRLVGLAGALGRRDADLLLDEPFGPLDPPHVARVAPLLDDRAGEDAVLVATHDPQVAARADRVLLLDGEPVARGPPRQVLQPEPLSTCYGARMDVVGTELGPVVRADVDRR